MGFILFILSFILVVLFTPIGMLFTLIKAIFLTDLSYINKYYFNLAISLDQFGNIVMSGLFNQILVTSHSANHFGNPDETISSVIGKNKIAGTLTMTGYILDRILNRLDDNHSIKSIEE